MFEPDVTRVTWHFFLFMQWDYGKFVLKELDYEPQFSKNDSQLGYLLVENSGS